MKASVLSVIAEAEGFGLLFRDGNTEHCKCYNRTTDNNKSSHRVNSSNNKHNTDHLYNPSLRSLDPKAYTLNLTP